MKADMKIRDYEPSEWFEILDIHPPMASINGLADA
jgi:hypothetical protein